MFLNHYKRLEQIKFENIEEGDEIHRKIDSFYTYQTHTCIIYKKTNNQDTTLIVEIYDNKIRLNTFKNFNIFNTFYIRNDYEHKDRKSKGEVMKDIIKYLNETYNYHIVYNNCQYFTMKCILNNVELVDTKYKIAEFEKILYIFYKICIMPLPILIFIYIIYKLITYGLKFKRFIKLFIY